MGPFRAIAARRSWRVRMRRASGWLVRLLSVAVLIFAVFGSPRLVSALAGATESVGCCPHHEDTEDGQKQCCCGTHARSDQFFSSNSSCNCGATQGAFVSPAVELRLLPAPLATDFVLAIADPASLHGRLDHVRIERPPRTV